MVVVAHDKAFVEESVCAVLSEIHAEGVAVVGADEVMVVVWERSLEEMLYWAAG